MKKKNDSSSQSGGIIAIRPILPVVSDSFLERPSPKFYPDWNNYVDGGNIKALAASTDTLWAVTQNGIISWHLDRKRGFYYTYYGSEHGLPGNRFSDIALDYFQKPWVSSLNYGLAYLEHTQWKRFSEANQSSERVYLLANGAKDSLFAATESGILQITTSTGNVHSTISLPKHFLYEGINALCATPQNDLYIGTSWGVYIHQNSNWSSLAIPDGLYSNEITALLITPQQEIWVGTIQGLSVFGSEGLKGKFLEGVCIYDLAYLETSDNVIIVTDRGILSHRNGMVHSWHLPKSLALKFAQPQQLAVSSSSNQIYIGSSYGILNYNGDRLKEVESANSGQCPLNITDLAIDNNHNIWAGTPSNLWLYKENTWRKVQPLNRPIKNISTILTTDNGMWVGSWQKGTYGGLRYFRAGVEIKKYEIPATDLVLDCTGVVWSVNNNDLQTFDGEKWITMAGSPNTESVVLSFVLNHDQIWCGTSAGLYFCTKTNQEWHLVPEFTNRPIYALQISKHNLWVATNRGLYTVKTSTQETRHIETIPTNVSVHALALDDDGSLWVGSSTGLFQIENNKMQFHWTVNNSGLAHSDVRCLSLDTRNNLLWIGTANGISQFNISIGSMSEGNGNV